jgi:hypothetical protein
MAWSWTAVADPKLAGLLNGPFQTLANYLGLAEKVLPVQTVVRTTDATVTTLEAVTIPVNKTLLCTGLVVARRTGGASGSANDGAGYVVEFVAKNTAGTAALIGAGTVTTLGESVAGWDVTLSASGGTIRVRVTGAANTNITWNWSGKTLTGKE